MKKYFACFLSLALLILSSITSLLQPMEAGTASPAHNDLDSQDSVSVIVELSGDSVIDHQKAKPQNAKADHRMQLDSLEARAHLSRLESEHKDFISQAETSVSGIRVKTELYLLANAVSVEIPRNQLAALRALPGIKRIEATKVYRTKLTKSVSLIGAPAA